MVRGLNHRPYKTVKGTQMEEKEEILNELDQTAPVLKGIDKRMLFRVPDGYFDVFPISMVGKMAGTQKPAVPEGYFESFPATLLAKIRAMETPQEADEISHLLAGISKKMPFSVPQGYFEQFTVQPVGYQAPVIPIASNRRRFSWAVAASVIIVTGLFAWFYLFNNKGPSNQPVVKTTTNEVVDSSFSAALAGIEDTSIHSELNSDDITGNTLSALYYLNTDNIETALQDFTEEEIKSQLNERVVLKNKS